MLAIRLQCTPQRIAEPIWLVQLWCSAWNHKPVVSLDLADNYLVCQAPCLLMDTHATGHLSWFHHVCCFFFLCTTGPLPLHNHFFPFSEVLFEGNFMHCAKKELVGTVGAQSQLHHPSTIAGFVFMMALSRMFLRSCCIMHTSLGQAWIRS